MVNCSYQQTQSLDHAASCFEDFPCGESARRYEAIAAAYLGWQIITKQEYINITNLLVDYLPWIGATINDN